MKPYRFLLILPLLSGTGHASDSLRVFRPGDTARAAEVNANFKILWNLYESLAAANQALLAKVDSLQKTIPGIPAADTVGPKLAGLARENADTRKAVDSLKLEVLPKGTIIASMLAPGADGYLPNSGQTWLLAAGQAGVNGVTIPDLRGVFLRGLDYAIAGKALTSRDSARAPGSYQVDATKYPNAGLKTNSTGSHSHLLNLETTASRDASGMVLNTVAYPLIGTNRSTSESGAHSHAISGGDEETRPENVAVFYYIKVK